jgi:uncharacterized protein YecT (DUF1311 family)
MHTCFYSPTSAPSPLCNEKIAMNAVAHGVAYGSVMAFMTFTPASDMIWFNAADVDCWGLSRWPPGFGKDRALGDLGPCVEEALRKATQPSRREVTVPTTLKPSFDCTKATTGLEKAFCADPELAKLDGEMGVAYNRKIRSLPPQQQRVLQSDQLRWLRQRSAACGMPNTASMDEWLRPEMKKCAAETTVRRTLALQ